MTRGILLFLLLVALVQTTVAFSARKPALLMASRTITSCRLSTARFAQDDSDDSAAAPSGDEEPVEEAVIPPPPVAASNAPPPVPPKRLDPLIASLTRNDRIGSSNEKTTNLPLLGEIPIDGSLVVLVPAVVIGLVGIVMSINIAMNAQDSIVSQLTELSQDINDMAVQKTNVVPPEGTCRGLCSSQEEDLNNLKVFMDGLRK